MPTAVLTSDEYLNRMSDITHEFRVDHVAAARERMQVAAFARNVDALAAHECRDPKLKTLVDAYLRALLLFMTEADKLTMLTQRAARARIPVMTLLDRDMVAKRHAMVMYITTGQ